jgi:hypothetical protein
MYVTRVPNRSSPPAVLLRENWREGGKVKSRTLANLTHWPEAKVEALRRVLRGETVVVAGDRFAIERSLPHGHVAAVLGLVRNVGLDRLLPRRPERLAKLVLALIVARVVEPAAKLSTARQLSAATASHSLGAVLGLGEVDEDELYRALDLLGAAQPVDPFFQRPRRGILLRHPADIAAGTESPSGAGDNNHGDAWVFFPSSKGIDGFREQFRTEGIHFVRAVESQRRDAVFY